MNEFNDEIIRKDNDNFATLYSAICKDDSLRYKSNNQWVRESNEKVALKSLDNSQNLIDEFLNEVWKFF